MHVYKVGDYFYYCGNYPEFHGILGQVTGVKSERGYYSCRMITDIILPIVNWRLHTKKMIPYNREPDWEV
jgi:hypothetical protein